MAGELGKLLLICAAACSLSACVLQIPVRTFHADDAWAEGGRVYVHSAGTQTAVEIDPAKLTWRELDGHTAAFDAGREGVVIVKADDPRVPAGGRCLFTRSGFLVYTSSGACYFRKNPTSEKAACGESVRLLAADYLGDRIWAWSEQERGLLSMSPEDDVWRQARTYDPQGRPRADPKPDSSLCFGRRRFAFIDQDRICIGRAEPDGLHVDREIELGRVKFVRFNERDSNDLIVGVSSENWLDIWLWDLVRIRGRRVGHVLGVEHNLLYYDASRDRLLDIIGDRLRLLAKDGSISLERTIAIDGFVRGANVVLTILALPVNIALLPLALPLVPFVATFPSGWGFAGMARF